MGCRSQNQNGSIQKCKKRGTKMKRYRRGEGYRVSVNSRMHFIPSVHCLLCKKRAVSKELAAKYKKGHHERCPKKKENVQKYQERQGRFAWHQAAQPQASAATAATLMAQLFGVQSWCTNVSTARRTSVPMMAIYSICSRPTFRPPILYCPSMLAVAFIYTRIQADSWS